jgi:hypothetical protein
MFSSFVVSLGFFVAGKAGHPAASTTVLLVTVAATTVVWLVVTYATPPVPREALAAFYAKVRPAGPGWAAVRRDAGLPPSPDSPVQAFAGWGLGLAAIYGALFATGAFVYGRPAAGAVWGAVSVAGVIGLVTIVRRTFTSGASFSTDCTR